MNYKPLKDLCDIRKGQAITGNRVVEGRVPVVAGGKTVPYYHNVANRDADIITISASGAYAGYVNYWSVPIFASDCTTIKPSVELLTTEYLYAFLKSKQEYIYSLQKGAGQPHIYGKDIENIEIPLPPIDTQRKIAAILDKAQELIDLRKAQIEKLDDFLRSVFLDMFGDPVTNPKGWEVDRLDNVAEIVSGVAKGRKLVNQQTVFVPYMRVANVQDGHLVLDEIKQIEVLPSDVTKYALLDGDLLATEGGDPDKLGRCAIWKGQIKECIHQNHIFRIRLQTNKVMPEYVSFLMGSKHGKKYFLRSSKQTTGIASINSTQLKSFPAFLPPLPLQQQFAAIVEKTEQQKTLMQQSLTEMENNFSSLMQQAFRGELF